MKKIFFIAILLILSGCADNITLEQAIEVEKVGFWYGLWHGITILFSLIGSLFMDDITIYAIYNNGFGYNFGYTIGVSSITIIRK